MALYQNRRGSLTVQKIEIFSSRRRNLHNARIIDETYRGVLASVVSIRAMSTTVQRHERRLPASRECREIRHELLRCGLLISTFN